MCTLISEDFTAGLKDHKVKMMKGYPQQDKNDTLKQYL
jgi:hypothetical protein